MVNFNDFDLLASKGPKCDYEYGYSGAGSPEFSPKPFKELQSKM